MPREDAHGQTINEAWLIPSEDRFACPEAPYDCNLAPPAVNGTSLAGTPWEHYRLRYTQVTFTTPMGVPLLRANSNLETGFQLGASCMTCHALSAIGPMRVGDVSANRINMVNPNSAGEGPFSANGTGGFIGAPNPALFDVPGMPGERYLQLDFLWSLGMCANWETPPIEGQQPLLCGEPPDWPWAGHDTR